MNDGASFDTVLEAARYSVTLSDQDILARGSTTLASIQLYKALGGGWSERLGEPIIPDEMIEEMKEETDWWTFGGKKRLSAPR